MGRSSTPKYVVEMNLVRGESAVHAWRCRSYGCLPAHGMPNAKNLERHVRAYNASLEPGGVNEHVGPMARATAAVVRENCSGGEVIAEWRAPMFELV